MVACRRERQRRVRRRFRGYPGGRTTADRHSVDLPLVGPVLRRGKHDAAAVAGKRREAHFIASLRQLSRGSTGGGHDIQMIPAVLVAGVHDPATIRRIRCVLIVGRQVFLVPLPVDGSTGCRAHRAREERALFDIGRCPFDQEARAVRRPAEDAFGLLRCFEQPHVAPVGRHYRCVTLAATASEEHDERPGVLGTRSHPRCTLADRKREPTPVRRPGGRAGATIGRDLLRRPALPVHHEQVAAANERDPRPVGGKASAVFALGGLRQARCSHIGQRCDEQIATEAVHQRSTVGSPRAKRPCAVPRRSADESVFLCDLNRRPTVNRDDEQVLAYPVRPEKADIASVRRPRRPGGPPGLQVRLHGQRRAGIGCRRGSRP
jgi:hypothetical protein